MLEGPGGIEVVKYAFHFFNASGRTVFRYDNSPNHPEITTRPHHKHVGPDEVVVAADPLTIEEVLNEIRAHLATG